MRELILAISLLVVFGLLIYSAIFRHRWNPLPRAAIIAIGIIYLVGMSIYLVKGG